MVKFPITGSPHTRDVGSAKFHCTLGQIKEERTKSQKVKFILPQEKHVALGVLCLWGNAF